MLGAFKQRIAGAFNLAAPTYHQHAHIQARCAQVLAHDIKKHLINPPQTLLEIGSGTGLLTEHLLDYYPKTQYIAIDIADRLNQSLATKLKRYRPQVLCQIQTRDIEQHNLSQSYDLIASNMSLQWLEALPHTLQKLTQKTKILSFSLPIQSTFQAWQNLCHQYQLPLNLLPLPTPAFLERTIRSLTPSFCYFHYRRFRMELSVIDFIKHLRQTGAFVSNSNAHDTKRTISARSFFQTCLPINYDILFCTIKVN